MKKRRYTLLLMVAFAMIYGIKAQVQEPFKREFAIGFGGGINFSQVGFTPKVPQTFLQGIHGGLTVRWITQKSLGLTAELNFAQQGWKENFADVAGGEHYFYNRTINYIELPFMTHFYGGNKRVRFIFNVGPKIGYYLSESTEENVGDKEPLRTNFQHSMPVENKLDWGVCGGPGFELRTGIGIFILEGRFYMALGNIYGNSKADNFPKSNGMTISAKLSYLINIR